MKFFSHNLRFLLFILNILMLSATFSAEDCLDTKIGVEIETSSIKVSLVGESYSGFIINQNGQDIWRIEQDTTDLMP